MLKTTHLKPLANLFRWVILLYLCACGVKGDPLPPEKPPTLGRGQPSYRRAAEEIALPNLPPMDFQEEEEKEEDDEEEEEF